MTKRKSFLCQKQQSVVAQTTLIIMSKCEKRKRAAIVSYTFSKSMLTIIGNIVAIALNRPSVIKHCAIGYCNTTVFFFQPHKLSPC
jgi:hypothetical protein